MMHRNLYVKLKKWKLLYLTYTERNSGSFNANVLVD